MPKIIEYAAIGLSDGNKFLENCNELVKRGYIPQGGISLCLDKNREPYYAQAFILLDREQDIVSPAFPVELVDFVNEKK